MKKALLAFACAFLVQLRADAASRGIVSPNGRVACTFALEAKHPCVRVSFDGKPVFSSDLGVRDFAYDWQCVTSRMVKTSWKPVWGFRQTYPECYAELSVRLGRKNRVAADETLCLRCYDEGFAVRTKVSLETYSLGAYACERTNWRFVPECVAWGIADGEATFPAAPIPLENLKENCQWMMPLTVQVPSVGYASVFEANAVDHPRSFLRASKGVLNLHYIRGVREGRGEVFTPWRVVALADTPGHLIEQAYLIENLNAPCAIADTSWIKPGFSMSDAGNFKLRTPEVLACIDDAVTLGVKYLQIDWGWYGTEYAWSDDDRAAYLAKHPELKQDATWIENTRANPRTVAVGTVPYHPYWPYSGRSGVDLDLPAVIRACRAKGIGTCLYVHGSVLESSDLDSLFALYESWGVAGLKPGFVGYGSQYATCFIRRLAEVAAKYHLWLDIHDCHLPDGLERTWPNVMITEGGGGEEGDHPVRQDVTLPFTRCLVGPFDFTPALFHAGKAHASKAHKLAMFLCYPGPTAVMRGQVKLVAGNHPDAAAFLRALPWNYDATHVLDATIGQHLVLVRQKDKVFYVAGLTGEVAYETSLDFSFLSAGKTYRLTLLADDPSDAHEPRRYVKSVEDVCAHDVRKVKMLASGGFCAVLEEK